MFIPQTRKSCATTEYRALNAVKALNIFQLTVLVNPQDLCSFFQTPHKLLGVLISNETLHRYNVQHRAQAITK